MALERVITDGGFEDVGVESVMRTIRFGDPAVFVRLNTMALVGMSPAASTMKDDERVTLVDAIVEESAEIVRQYSTGGELVLELGANVATAHI